MKKFKHVAKRQTISMSFLASCIDFLSLMSLEASHVLMLSRNLCKHHHSALEVIFYNEMRYINICFTLLHTVHFMPRNDKLRWLLLTNVSACYINVKCNNDCTVRNNESLRRHCTNERKSGTRKWEEMWFKTTAEDGERSATEDDRWAA